MSLYNLKLLRAAWLFFLEYYTIYLPITAVDFCFSALVEVFSVVCLIVLRSNKWRCGASVVFVGGEKTSCPVLVLFCPGSVYVQPPEMRQIQGYML